MWDYNAKDVWKNKQTGIFFSYFALQCLYYVPFIPFRDVRYLEFQLKVQRTYCVHIIKQDMMTYFLGRIPNLETIILAPCQSDKVRIINYFPLPYMLLAPLNLGSSVWLKLKLYTYSSRNDFVTWKLVVTKNLLLILLFSFFKLFFIWTYIYFLEVDLACTVDILKKLCNILCVIVFFFFGISVALYSI